AVEDMVAARVYDSDASDPAVISSLALRQRAPVPRPGPLREELRYIDLRAIRGNGHAMRLGPDVFDRLDYVVLFGVDDGNRFRRWIGNVEAAPVRRERASKRLGTNVDRCHHFVLVRIDHGNRTTHHVGDVDLGVVVPVLGVIAGVCGPRVVFVPPRRDGDAPRLLSNLDLAYFLVL